MLPARMPGPEENQGRPRPSGRLAGPAPSGSTGTSRLCQGCSRPPRHHADQAALSYSDLLRQAAGEGLSPPHGSQRLTAQTESVPEPELPRRRQCRLTPAGCPPGASPRDSGPVMSLCRAARGRRHGRGRHRATSARETSDIRPSAAVSRSWQPVRERAGNLRKNPPRSMPWRTRPGTRHRLPVYP
jgi:hypothetical protein